MELTRWNDLLRGRRRYRGRWKLSSSDEVRYESEGLNEEFALTGVPVAAGPHELKIAATVRQEDQKTVTRLWKLAGSWRADEKNRLVFDVERGSGRSDALVFGGAWQAGPNEIVYTLRRNKLKTKTASAQKLALSGRWDLTEAGGITYLVGGDTEAGIRFRGAFQTRSILAKKGEIRYQIGVEAAGRRRLQEVSVFGKWKVSRDLALHFQTDARRRGRALILGGEYSLDAKSRVAVDLETARGQKLGVRLVLTRDIFGDGEMFARVSRELRERRVEAGVGFKW